MLRASVFAVVPAMTSAANLTVPTVPAGFETLVKPSPS